MSDPRSNLWKRMYHPDGYPDISPVAAPTVRTHQLTPSPPPSFPDQLNLSDSDESYSDGNRSSSPESKVSLLSRPTVMSKVLSQHAPHLKAPTFTSTSTARVLTSLENRSKLEEKVKEKKRKEDLKE